MSESLIKSVIINGKKVPVPIPVCTLGEVISWIQNHLLQKEDTITKIEMNGIEIESELVQGIKASLSAETILEFKVDTPFHLMIQSIETIRNFCSILLQGVKQLAVDLWQLDDSSTQKVLRTLQNFQSDLLIIMDLVDNINVIDDRFQEYIGRLVQHHRNLQQVSLAIDAASAKSNWQGCAKLLLNHLEPKLATLVEDATVVESDIFTVSTKEGIRNNSL